MNLNIFLSATTLASLSFIIPTLNLHEANNSSEANFSNIVRNQNNLMAQQQENIVSANGYKFKFTGCQAYSVDELSCTFLVSNARQLRTLQLFAQRSKIIDQNGDTIAGSLAILGEAPPFCQMVCVMGDSEKLPTRVPIKGEVIFKSPTAGKNILSNYIEFDFNRFKVSFTANN